jgi:diadenosine tetraphosphate (Ap4A) HIT family hydrolase
MTGNDTPADWSLHPHLERDTVPVGDLKLSRVLLINDANYPWVLLVPRRAGAVEMIDLSDAEQVDLMAEIARASRVMKAMTGCAKINVAALGNMVPQLHVHVIARGRSDPAWPKPVWGAVPPRVYGKAALISMLTDLRERLDLPTVQ